MNSPGTRIDGSPEKRRLRIQDITHTVPLYGYTCNRPGCSDVVYCPEGTAEYYAFMVCDYHIEQRHPEDPRCVVICIGHDDALTGSSVLEAWAQNIRDRPGKHITFVLLKHG